MGETKSDLCFSMVASLYSGQAKTHLLSSRWSQIQKSSYTFYCHFNHSLCFIQQVLTFFSQFET